MIDIYITDDDLRFRQIVIGHRQLLSTGIGTSRREAQIYFIEEIDHDYGFYGKIIAAPWIAPVLIRDLIMRDVVHGETEVDKICGHLTRIYNWSIGEHFRRPAHNDDLPEKCRICLPLAVTIEFEGVNRFIPNGSVFDPNTP